MSSLMDFLAPREERLEFGGEKLIVREMGAAADAQAFRDGQDASFKFIVRCVFYETGEPAFTDDDIPALKKASKLKLAPLLDAVNRVMGFDLEDEVKNSSAVPSAG